MQTITKLETNEIIINKSKFITVITPIKEKREIEIFLKNIKNKYKDATHYCFAYIIEGEEKCDDNGEPSGTAGMPILKVLKINNLTNILCIVIRYFGGIKLGAGGLIRAYSTSASEALNKCEIKEIKNGFTITITFPYHNLKQIDHLLKNIKIDKSYENEITYTFDIYEEDYLKIKNILETYSVIINKKPVKLT